MTQISVITIVKNRENALKNFVSGLSKSSVLPDELIIVYMNEEPHNVKKATFPIHALVCNSPELIPLASARNAGAASATSDKLIFLDIDCIPSPDLIRIYTENWLDDHLISGEIRYLSETAMQDFNLFTSLDKLSSPDLIRSNLHSITYDLFWSLNFGCSRSAFQKIGGFDEMFKGYGAEDTDFAYTARKAGIGISVINARAYHQYHQSYSPPLNHLEDIVDNARLFYRKWHTWPMKGWLTVFKKNGFINWNDNAISILRLPTQNELQQFLKVTN